MCGLAVSIRRNGPVEAHRLQEALRQLSHRGPDAAGMAFHRVNDSDGSTLAEVGFAHARLAILDLDPRSNQPFQIDGHTLAYNGEIYNYRALAQGMDLDTEGDTEVFLRLLMRKDPLALHNANGMWAYCWLDSQSRKLVAGRDRYGKKPLFYAIDKDAIHFASEPRSLAALLGQPLSMKAQTLDRFMADGWLFPDPTGETHLHGIREVRPGHQLTLDLNNWTLKDEYASCFAHPVDAPRSERTSASLAPLLANAVEARLVSHRKVGLFLSGGVDSSLILSVLAARGLTKDVVCILGDAGKSDDMLYASACIEQLGIEAMRIPLRYDSQGLEQFLAVCKAQAKPFPLIGNVLGMHALYASVAEHDIRVVIDGSGADEIFGGYWQRYFAYAMRDAVAAGDTPWIASVRPAMPRHFSHQSSQTDWMPDRECLSPAEMAMLKPEMAAVLSRTAAHDPLLNFKGSLADALHCDSTAGRMQEWLWQNDRNAMASSIENRSPFLDYRLAKWTATPYHQKFTGEWNKRELRDLFAHFVPLPTAQRVEKQGFRWAYAAFFQQNMRSILAMIEGSTMARRYVDPSTLVEGLKSGTILLSSGLLQRLTVMAGLEATGLTFNG